MERRGFCGDVSECGKRRRACKESMETSDFNLRRSTRKCARRQTEDEWLHENEDIAPEDIKSHQMSLKEVLEYQPNESAPVLPAFMTPIMQLANPKHFRNLKCYSLRNVMMSDIIMNIPQLNFNVEIETKFQDVINTSLLTIANIQEIKITVTMNSERYTLIIVKHQQIQENVGEHQESQEKNVFTLKDVFDRVNGDSQLLELLACFIRSGKSLSGTYNVNASQASEQISFLDALQGEHLNMYLFAKLFDHFRKKKIFEQLQQPDNRIKLAKSETGTVEIVMKETPTDDPKVEVKDNIVKITGLPITGIFQNIKIKAGKKNANRLKPIENTFPSIIDEIRKGVLQMTLQEVNPLLKYGAILSMEETDKTQETNILYTCEVDLDIFISNVDLMKRDANEYKYFVENYNNKNNFLTKMTALVELASSFDDLTNVFQRLNIAQQGGSKKQKLSKKLLNKTNVKSVIKGLKDKLMKNQKQIRKRLVNRIKNLAKQVSAKKDTKQKKQKAPASKQKPKTGRIINNLQKLK